MHNHIISIVTIIFENNIILIISIMIIMIIISIIIYMNDSNMNYTPL